MIHVSVTCPDEDSARRIAQEAITARLAACANMVPGVVSLFHWQGRVEDEPEVLLVFKTTEAYRAELVDRITAMHPYDLPVITWETLGTTPEATGWLDEETGARPQPKGTE